MYPDAAVVEPALLRRAQEPARSATAEMLPLMVGEMKDYQLKGVRWLISLYQNGLNGILADQASAESGS